MKCSVYQTDCINSEYCTKRNACCAGDPHCTPPTVGQYEDGTWWWLDETWNYGDDVRYPTREAASEAQARYCAEVLGP